MKIGDEGIAATKIMFTVRNHSYYSILWKVTNTQLHQNLEGKISTSLDAWTSPNNIAFLGIVAHYTNNVGELGTFLNFQTWPTYLYREF